jgi:antibiotic biosynthesis monooxygenase (ABM) superfamily enzyme
MIEHVGNCHGEWNLLIMAFMSIPIVGWRIRNWLHRRKHDREEKHA